MDRTLDEIISERPRGRTHAEPPREPRRAPPPRAPRREEYPRDGVRKNRRDDRTNLDTDWVHDRFEEDRYERERGARRAPLDHERYERPLKSEEAGTKLKVDNIHYELNETDLRELFERIGPVQSVRLLYDRMDRSEGTAFITYHEPRDAQKAIQNFDGANANGQPIRLTLLPTAPAASSKGTLFERVERPPGRSLFDRIEGGPPPGSRNDVREDEGGRRMRRNRSESPRRRAPAAAHEGVDRYVPGGAGGGAGGYHRSRSPVRRRGTPRDSGRRPGQRREDNSRSAGGRRGRVDDDGRPMVGGRPRKTAEELDAEMEDYWGAGGKPEGEVKANGAVEARNGAAVVPAPAPPQPADDDIDMIE